MYEMELQIASSEGTVFRGNDMPYPAESCAKMAQPIEIPFGVVDSRGPKEACGVHWRRLANSVEPSVYGGDSALCPTRWLYCVECPQYSTRLEVVGYLCDCASRRVQG